MANPVVVSGGTQINLLVNGDTLNTVLNATAPLYQTFKKGSSDMSPNWATMPDASRPIIFPRIYSTMNAVEITDITNVSWKYNGVVMAFDGSGIATAPSIAAGKVQKVTYQGKESLKMIGNIASDSNNDSDIVTYSGIVFASGQSIAVSAEITILVEEAANNLYRLFLSLDDDVVSGDETGLLIEAQLFNDGAVVAPAAVQYEFVDFATQAVLRAKGAPTYTIPRSAINSELLIQCKAYVNDVVVAHEQRQVWDSTDTYVVLCDQGERPMQRSNQTVVYTYSVSNVRTNTIVTGKVFTFKVLNLRTGADISSEFTKTSTSVTVTGTQIKTHQSIYIDAQTVV